MSTVSDRLRKQYTRLDPKTGESRLYLEGVVVVSPKLLEEAVALEARLAKGIALVKHLQGDSEYPDLGVILAALEGHT